MLGEDYDSLEEFRSACTSNRTALDPSKVIGKVYLIKQVRRVAEWFEVDTEETIKGVSHRRGVSRRYDIADAIARVRDAKEIGEALSRLDHEFYFPVLTYLRFSRGEQYSSVRGLLKYLNRQGNIQVSSDEFFETRFNGITEPIGRSCKLESIYTGDVDGDTVSLLFSCTRVLVIPEGQQSSVEYFFLARIPVVARILFRYRLIEIAMPTFSEPAGFSLDSSNRVPDRFQTVNWSTRAALANVLPYELQPVSCPKVTLYLETRLEAVDLGWRIEPQDEASFDLQGLIPLKDILGNFSQSLKKECLARNLAHPLAEMDLYRVFRALKEQSYTYSFVLSVPLGRRGGSVLVQVLYGPPNSGRDPILLIRDNNAGIAEAVRHAVCQSQIAELENRYDLETLLTEGA